MMNGTSGLDLFSHVCRASRLGADANGEILNRVISDGGVDTESLSLEDLLAGLSDSDGGHWHKLSFGLDELLAQYIAMDEADPEWDECAALAAVVAIVILSHSTKRGLEDSSMLFDNVCRIIYKLRSHVDLVIRIEVIRYFIDSVEGVAS